MKATIIGMGNEGDYSYFIFKKTTTLPQVLHALIVPLLGENAFVADELVYEYGCHKDCEKSIRRPKMPSDKRYNYRGRGFCLDIIFGERAVFLVGTLSAVKRKKIMKAVRTMCTFT